MEGEFHNHDSDGVGDALNIFLFPDLSPSAGLEAALLTRKWDAILGGDALTSFVDTSILIGKQKVSPIVGWDEAASQLESGGVFCTVCMVDDGVHPATYEMFLLLEETFSEAEGKFLQQPTFPPPSFT